MPELRRSCRCADLCQVTKPSAAVPAPVESDNKRRKSEVKVEEPKVEGFEWVTMDLTDDTQVCAAVSAL